MDHAIDGLRVYYDVALEELVQDWKSDNYQKLSDCPSYREAKAYREAINVLVNACYIPEYADSHLIEPLSKQVKVFENFRN
jgi:hypothetical protein